ncbi:MAG: hypothetical protein ACI93R_004227, partial [Flavobacteriales bacterium]
FLEESMLLVIEYRIEGMLVSYQSFDSGFMFAHL